MKYIYNYCIQIIQVLLLKKMKIIQDKLYTCTINRVGNTFFLHKYRGRLMLSPSIQACNIFSSTIVSKMKINQSYYNITYQIFTLPPLNIIHRFRLWAHTVRQSWSVIWFCRHEISWTSRGDLEPIDVPPKTIKQ